MSITSLPDGAVCVAAPTCRCQGCASRDDDQADYALKYVYPLGVFHPNCYAELSLCVQEEAECVEALLRSVVHASPQSAEVRPLQRTASSWSDDDELCDAHLAVWLG